MAVPDFQTCMRPILTLLSDGKAWSQAQLRDAVAEALKVSDEDQLELLPSGKQTTFSNRLGWALTHLSKAKLVDRPVRAQYLITERGRTVLAEHPVRVDMSVLFAFPEYQQFRALKHPKELAEKALPPGDEVSPSEAVGKLVEASDSAVAVDLLDRRPRPVKWCTRELRTIRIDQAALSVGTSCVVSVIDVDVVAASDSALM